MACRPTCQHCSVMVQQLSGSGLGAHCVCIATAAAQGAHSYLISKRCYKRDVLYVFGASAGAMSLPEYLVRGV
jgi:hypothetical protein